MLINELLTARRRSDFAIIKDNINFNGVNILKKFIGERINRNIEVHLILTEYDLTNFDISPKVIIHKYFPDPWRLLSIKGEQMNFELLIEKILNEGSPAGGPFLIVIDSIASLLQYVDLHLVCNCIKQVTSRCIVDGIPVAQILTILHSELIPAHSKEFMYLNYIANTMIDAKQEPDGISTVNVVYRHLNGKVQTELYCCSYNSNNELLFEIRKNPPKPKKEENDDILVKTTFKLTLEEKEKESRSQVVLPYLKASNTIKKGRIFYEPDINDDWDDEDPDDDLEI